MLYELLGFREIMPVTPDGRVTGRSGRDASVSGTGCLMKHPSRSSICWSGRSTGRDPALRQSRPSGFCGINQHLPGDDINTLVKAGVTLLSEQPAEVVPGVRRFALLFP